MSKANETKAKPTPSPSRRASARVHKGIFQSRDGTQLYYEVRGKGRPLLFAYGLTCKMEHWRHQLGHFAGRYQLITLDYRGHHRSGMPSNESHFTLKWCAKDLQDLIRYLDLPEVICLGHSMGVPVLVHLADLEPKRIKGMVFICGTVESPFKHMFHSNKLDLCFKYSTWVYHTTPTIANWLWHHLTKKNPLSFFLTSRLGFNASLSQTSDVERYMDGVHESPLATFQNLLYDYNRFDNRSKLLERIPFPCLVVAGEADCVTPMELSEKMAKLIPKAEIIKIPEGSHNAHMDLPGIVNRRIGDFLRKKDYR